MKVPAYAAPAAGAPLGPFTVERREPGPHDVLHRDPLSAASATPTSTRRATSGAARSSRWCPATRSSAASPRSARRSRSSRSATSPASAAWSTPAAQCEPCRDGLEQFCEKAAACTYNGTEMDRKTPTYGGYSTRIVVDESLRAADPGRARSWPAAAPLLCAGITTYSPLRQWNVEDGRPRRRRRPRRPRPHGGQARARRWAPR